MAFFQQVDEWPHETIFFFIGEGFCGLHVQQQNKWPGQKNKDLFKDNFSIIFKPYILHSVITVQGVQIYSVYKGMNFEVFEVIISNFPNVLFAWFKNQENSNVWIWKYCCFEFFEVVLMNNLSCDFPK